MIKFDRHVHTSLIVLKTMLPRPTRQPFPEPALGDRAAHGVFLVSESLVNRRYLFRLHALSALYGSGLSRQSS